MIRAEIGRIGRFAAVGLCATALYALGAGGLSMLGAPAGPASLAAFAAASVFSYLGHRFLSFQSALPLGVSAPRFAALTGVQCLLAFGLPAGAAALSLSPIWGILGVCVMSPLISFISMRIWVFRSANPAVRDA